MGLFNKLFGKKTDQINDQTTIEVAINIVRDEDDVVYASVENIITLFKNYVILLNPVEQSEAVIALNYIINQLETYKETE